jgi:hypothetical protein
VAQALEPAGAGVGQFIVGLLALPCAALLAWVAFVPLRPASGFRQAIPTGDNVSEDGKQRHVRIALPGALDLRQ